MDGSNSEEGPKIVWTFPLMRRFQSNAGILNIGQRVQQAKSDDEPIVDGQRIRDQGSKIKDRVSSIGDDNDETEDLEEELDELEDNRESLFSSDDTSDSDSQHSINIHSDVFEPTRVNISEGDTVVWTNQDDETHKIMSISGEELSSGDIEAGETFEHTFDSKSATVYIDSIKGGDVMSGAVIVGDSDLERDLPSSTDVERVPLNNGDTETPTLSDAGEQKQEMVETRR
jgi:plastocyanin